MSQQTRTEEQYILTVGDNSIVAACVMCEAAFSRLVGEPPHTVENAVFDATTLVLEHLYLQHLVDNRMHKVRQAYQQLKEQGETDDGIRRRFYGLNR